MMDYEIKIIPNENEDKDKKGLFFEKLVSEIFCTQRYEIIERVNFTGSEIDIICKHKDKDEEIFVECKARDTLSANDLKKFIFDVQFRNTNFGYFLYTNTFQHQAAGLIEELKKNENYKNIYFWNAKKCYELLAEAKIITPFSGSKIKDFTATKMILFYSFFGNYQIVILSDSTIPNYYTILNCSGNQLSNKNNINKIKKYIGEISTLTYISPEFPKGSLQENIKIDIIAETQESDFWYDYKPASLTHFVGRKKILESIFNFLNSIYAQESNKRIFYIQGKSGWGKSSIVNYIRGKSKKNPNKNKFFCLSFDTRSAETEQFISGAFQRAIEMSIKKKFITYKNYNIQFTSNYDLLKNDTIIKYTNELAKKNKFLIIIFDQFEDVFRKEGLAKAFYKFLFDVHDLNSNVILGFSWKSEITIPIDHEAYYLWQQSKDYVYQFELPEFIYNESLSIIKQLEREIKKPLAVDFQRKIIDNSQGFPWLVKKLCIHILNKIKSGVKLNDLFEKNINIEQIFEDDISNLSKKEIKLIKYIAKRAFNNNPLDVIELDDKVNEKNITELIHKRILIKSGSKYNIYWDVFRDYLVTNKVPIIGETYLIRQNVHPVVDIFLTMKYKKKYSVKNIQKINDVSEGTALNLLRELINLGLVQYDSKLYHISSDKGLLDEEKLKHFLKNKLKKHNFYIFLSSKSETIDYQELSDSFKNLFKSSSSYSDKTIETYIRFFLSWLKYCDLEIPNISKDVKAEVNKLISFTPQNPPDQVITFFRKKRKTYATDDIPTTKLLYDLKNLKLLSYNRGKINYSAIGLKALTKTENLEPTLINEAVKTEKIRKSYEIIKDNPSINSKNFKKEISSLLKDIHSYAYKVRVYSVLFKWGKFINENKKKTESNYN
jgi:hypothetical protein